MKSEVRKMSEAAVLLALSVLLPLAFHAIPNSGSIFLPMHIPALLAGFILGPFYGALVGLLSPLLGFLIMGMPPVSALPAMMAELLVYGVSSGVFYRLIKTHHFYLDIYLSLILSWLSGRLVGGGINALLYARSGNAYSFALFFTAYFIKAWPGLLIQFFLIPAILLALTKSHLLPPSERSFSATKKERLAAEETSRFFDTLAPSWEKRSLDPNKIQALLSQCVFPPEAKILDIGCGNGVLETYLAAKGDVLGIDLSGEMIAMAIRKDFPENVHFRQNDFYELPAERIYDVLIVFDAYPHFLDKDAFAAKAASLLKKGGRLYILHDSSKENINAHHKEKGEGNEKPLQNPHKEAFPFWQDFRQGKMEDAADHFLLELIRR